MVVNFTPRVMENFGLSWDAIRELNPRCIFLRMPAFGLSGPWRDNTGFAQTMEQMTGLAWLTGHPDDQPRIQRGPCDPLSGMHAVFATLRALEERGAVTPDYVAGHSLGEYAALVASGALAFEDAVRLVNARGRFMQEAVPEGR